MVELYLQSHICFHDVELNFLIKPRDKFTVFMGQSRPIRVAARSKAWIVFARSNAGIVISHPTWGMDVYVRLFCVCVVLCVGRRLAMTDPPSKDSYRLCIGSRNRKSCSGPTKGCRAIIIRTMMGRARTYGSDKLPRDTESGNKSWQEVEKEMLYWSTSVKRKRC
jgi:hypothetical protein